MNLWDFIRDNQGLFVLLSAIIGLIAAWIGRRRVMVIKFEADVRREEKERTTCSRLDSNEYAAVVEKIRSSYEIPVFFAFWGLVAAPVLGLILRYGPPTEPSFALKCVVLVLALAWLMGAVLPAFYTVLAIPIAVLAFAKRPDLRHAKLVVGLIAILVVAIAWVALVGCIPMLIAPTPSN